MLARKARMGGYQGPAVKDPHDLLVPLDLHGLANEAARHRVALGVQVHSVVLGHPLVRPHNCLPTITLPQHREPR